MSISEILFWVSLSVLFYCYIGYGLLLFVFNRLSKLFPAPHKEMTAETNLRVTIIIAAYNEGALLEQKVKNTLAIDYPSGLLKIIFVTDGSVDGSEYIIKRYPSLISLHQPQRKGKLAAIRRAMDEVDTPVVVFSDANAMLNPECIRRIVTHYNDPSTGGVAGEKKISREQHPTAVGEAEGLYWKYESFMKKQDADFNSVVGAAGELFSIRTSLFSRLDENIILDDFVISMKVCLQGYRIEYEPGAFATEFPSASLADEAKRKIRISAGAYQSIGYLSQLFNIFKYPLLSFQYISRRLLRWVFCPFMLIVLLLANIWIVNKQPHDSIYTVSLWIHSLFYLFAFVGWMIIRKEKTAGILTIPFYFVFMNYCLVRGFIKFMKKQQSVLWEKAMRQESKLEV
jgi:biofilm PGA synthesis N-glycosyltransferase PgaC